ncbi:MAG: hypothetical protein AAFP08_04975 [Bacteroidota bacterium]
MSISGILPMLICSAAFLIIGYLVWRKNKAIAAVIGFIGLVLFIHSFGILTNDHGDKLARKNFEKLLSGLDAPDLWAHLEEEADEAELMFAGLSSMALYRGAKRFPEHSLRAQTIMKTLVDWVSDTRRFPAWTERSKWSQHAFFLAQAASIIGHYQSLSADETYAPSFQAAAEYLGRNMPRSPYKMLVSRPVENLFRPSDNAAAIYAISLHDRYYATEYLETATQDWLQYVSSELTYRESRLPCSAFSETDRCRYAPNATALGLTYAYLSAAYEGDMPPGIANGFLEWNHYFKQRNLSPYSLQIRTLPRGQADPNSCNLAAQPLGCERYENAIGLWLSSEQSGWYTYARLFNGLRLRNTFGKEISLSQWTARRRIVPMTRLAIETLGLLH